VAAAEPSSSRQATASRPFGNASGRQPRPYPGAPTDPRPFRFARFHTYAVRPRGRPMDDPFQDEDLERRLLLNCSVVPSPRRRAASISAAGREARAPPIRSLEAATCRNTRTRKRKNIGTVFPVPCKTAGR
jgi:hypothetical protein